MRVSAAMSSSVMPSLKNSLSGSALMFTNGSTAIERGTGVAMRAACIGASSET